VGSIYHFFPTKDAIFSAIRARYDVEASAIAANILTHATEWARLDLEDLVHHVMSPFADFLERIPAFFALGECGWTQAAEEQGCRRHVRAAMLTALAHRWPDATPEARAMRVDVMMAIGDGVSNVMVQADPAGPPTTGRRTDPCGVRLSLDVRTRRTFERVAT
jgi:AcrR family transcriptional regulator